MEKTDKETAMVFYEIKADYALTTENVDEEVNPLLATASYSLHTLPISGYCIYH